jgi:hypothetical protein
MTHERPPPGLSIISTVSPLSEDAYLRTLATPIKASMKWILFVPWPDVESRTGQRRIQDCRGLKVDREGIGADVIHGK